jgi:hypothetical protein
VQVMAKVSAEPETPRTEGDDDERWARPPINGLPRLSYCPVNLHWQVR